MLFNDPRFTAVIIHLTTSLLTAFINFIIRLFDSKKFKREHTVLTYNTKFSKKPIRVSKCNKPILTDKSSIEKLFKVNLIEQNRTNRLFNVIVAICLVCACAILAFSLYLLLTLR